MNQRDIGTGNSIFEYFTVRGDRKSVLDTEFLPARINGSGICICREGEGEFILDQRQYRIRKGDMVVVFPNTILQTIRKSKDFLGYTVAVSTEFIQSIPIPSATALYLFIKDNPCISLSGVQADRLVQLCGQLKETDSRKDYPYRKQIVKLQLVIISYEIAAVYQSGKPLACRVRSRQDRIFQRFILLLSKYYQTEREIAFYADKLCITPKYLSRVVRNISGSSVPDWINRMVILHAKTLLGGSELTVQQIADKLNFSNASFFGTYFKRLTGETPGNFRARRSDL